MRFNRPFALATFLFASIVAADTAAAQTVRIVAPGREDIVSIPVAARPAQAMGAQADGPLNAAQIRAVQSALTRAGYEPGPHDGLIGPRVRASLSAFQADRGLTVCGCIDEATSGALGLPVRVVHAGSGRVEILTAARSRPAPARTRTEDLQVAGLAPERPRQIVSGVFPTPWFWLGSGSVPSASSPTTPPASGRPLGAAGLGLRRVAAPIPARVPRR